jgi:hypothetical protein
MNAVEQLLSGRSNRDMKCVGLLIAPHRPVANLLGGQ